MSVNFQTQLEMMCKQYFWWPNLDEAILNLAKDCADCSRVRASPPKSPLYPWIWPSRPWQRVHANFAIYNGQHYLV